MFIFFINFIKILKKFWLIISFFLIITILLRKADEEDLNSLILPFLSNSKKSERFLDSLIWSLILIFLSLGLIFSIKNFY
jgi:protein translocase SecG subunit